MVDEPKDEDIDNEIDTGDGGDDLDEDILNLEALIDEAGVEGTDLPPPPPSKKTKTNKERAASAAATFRERTKDAKEAIAKANKQINLWKQRFDIFVSKVKKIFGFFDFIRSKIVRFFLDILAVIALAIKKTVLGIKDGIVLSYKGILATLKYLWGKYEALPKNRKIAFILLVGTIGGLYYLLINLQTIRLVTFLDDKTIYSLEQVAYRYKKYDAAGGFERFSSPLRKPEFIYELKKIVVRLRTNQDAPQALGAFEILFEANSRPAAVELQARETEVADVVTRVIETFSPDELNEPDGKSRMKKLIIKNINSFLTKGTIKNIYFRLFLMKR